jgi:hypothetical protein
MKAIIFGCLIIIFASCGKPTFDLNWNFSGGPIVDEYTFPGVGNYNPAKLDSSQKVAADIISNGMSSPFSAYGFHTGFYVGVGLGNSGIKSMLHLTALDVKPCELICLI